MIVKVYQSETDSYIEMESIGKVKYIGETFGVDSLTDGQTYDVLDVQSDGLIRVIDDSNEDYLYSVTNPAPLNASSKGGKWEIVEDKKGTISKIIKA